MIRMIRYLWAGNNSKMISVYFESNLFIKMDKWSYFPSRVFNWNHHFNHAIPVLSWMNHPRERLNEVGKRETFSISNEIQP